MKSLIPIIKSANQALATVGIMGSTPANQELYQLILDIRNQATDIERQNEAEENLIERHKTVEHNPESEKYFVISAFLMLFLMLFLFGCSTETQQPCPEQTSEQSVMKTALAAYMVSQNYYVDGCL